MPFARNALRLLAGVALLSAPILAARGQATARGESLLPHHSITILGHQDSLGRAITKALTDRIAADARGTNVRVTSHRDIDITLTQGTPWNWDGKFTDEDMRELGKLVHTTLLVIVQAERRGDTLVVRTGMRSPINAPIREFLGTVSGTSIQSIVDRVAPAILADTTYRRLRSRDPN